MLLECSCRPCWLLWRPRGWGVGYLGWLLGRPCGAWCRLLGLLLECWLRAAARALLATWVVGWGLAGWLLGCALVLATWVRVRGLVLLATWVARGAGCYLSWLLGCLHGACSCWLLGLPPGAAGYLVAREGTKPRTGAQAANPSSQHTPRAGTQLASSARPRGHPRSQQHQAAQQG